MDRIRKWVSRQIEDKRREEIVLMGAGNGSISLDFLAGEISSLETVLKHIERMVPCEN